MYTVAGNVALVHKSCQSAVTNISPGAEIIGRVLYPLIVLVKRTLLGMKMGRSIFTNPLPKFFLDMSRRWLKADMVINSHFFHRLQALRKNT